jgi:hypothetical protein
MHFKAWRPQLPLLIPAFATAQSNRLSVPIVMKAVNGPQWSKPSGGPNPGISLRR